MNDYFDPENAEGRAYTRSRYEPKLDRTGCYRVGGRAYVHSEVVRSMVSGLAQRVIDTDKQTFDAEAEAYAKMFAAGITSARKRVPDGAFSRHFVAAMIAVGHSLHLARVTGVAPSAEHVADRFVAEIDALERGRQSRQLLQPALRRRRRFFAANGAWSSATSSDTCPPINTFISRRVKCGRRPALIRACQRSRSAKTRTVRTSR